VALRPGRTQGAAATIMAHLNCASKFLRAEASYCLGILNVVRTVDVVIHPRRYETALILRAVARKTVDLASPCIAV
jgi:hypothetical protein